MALLSIPMHIQVVIDSVTLGVIAGGVLLREKTDGFSQVD